MNFEYLKRHLEQRGIDKLWVGVHSVNYETGEVGFDPNVCRAIQVNKHKRIYYGPIYIPEYQLNNEECYEG